MANARIPKQKTSVALSEDAKRLLELIAEKAGISQSAVLEIAIRDRARREKITLPNGAAAASARKEAARKRFRQLLEKARAGFDDLTPEEVEAEVRRAVAEVRESRRAGRH